MFHWMAVLVARYDSEVVAVILLVISAQNEVTEVTIAISSMVQYEHVKGFTTCVCVRSRIEWCILLLDCTVTWVLHHNLSTIKDGLIFT